MKRIGQFTIIFTALFLLAAGQSRAQFLPEPVSLVITPASPSPGQNVRIQAETPTFDKNTAVFRWSIGGRVQNDLSGIGKNSVTLTAPGVGSTITILVDVIKNTGETTHASATVYASDLSLPWTAETYRPAWYKGKALPVQSSVVNVYAIPQIQLDGAVVSPADLIYHWSLNDQENVVEGIGQQVFRIKTYDAARTSEHVSVMVEDIDHRIQKSGEVFIVSTKPKLLLYPVSPLGGPETRTALTFFETDKRGLLDFLAEPFFFATQKKQRLTWRWDVDGTTLAGNPANPWLLTIDTSNQKTGAEANLSVTVDDADPIRPAAQNSVDLRFK